MKVLVLLAAIVAVGTAFDFPEQWQLWKTVSCWLYALAIGANYY